MRVQYVDERQKQIAVQAVLIEVLRRDIRRCDTITPACRSALNNRARIIASAMSVTVNSSRHNSHDSRASASATGPIGSSPFTRPSLICWRTAKMRACTSAMKAWKWVRRLWLSSVLLEKHVHERGLAAPDRAPDINAEKGRRFLTRADKPAKRGALACRPVKGELRRKRLQLFQHLLLCGVALEFAAFDRAPNNAQEECSARGLRAMFMRRVWGSVRPLCKQCRRGEV